MCAKKLCHPPKLEPDFKIGPRVKPEDSFKDYESTAFETPTEKPKSMKPRIAGYLLILVIFMVAFEILIVVGVGANYKYASIYESRNDLNGKILDKATQTVISAEINISLSNYDHEFDYLFDKINIGKHTYNTTINSTTGEYRFSNIRCGRYVINVSIKGYITELRKVIIVPEDVNPEKDENTEDFEMVRNTTSSAKIINSGTFESKSLDDFINIAFSCFIINGICIVIALAGIIHCFKRKKYSIAVVGAIFGVITGLITIWTIGSILSVVAILLIVMSKEEFTG